MIARVLQKKIDALPCRLLAHESFGSPIIALRRKTVGATEIAIIGDVEYQAALREGLAGKIWQEGNWLHWFRSVLCQQDPQSLQLRETVHDGMDRMASAQGIHNLVRSQRSAFDGRGGINRLAVTCGGGQK